MSTSESQEATLNQQTSKDRNQSLLRRILKFKVFIICLTMILVGILFLVIASYLSNEGVPGEGLPGHLLRDIGIVLITTGLVVFAADYMTRKDFIALLATELDPLREEVRISRQSMLGEMAPLKTDMSSLLSKLLQEVTPLRQDIPTLSTALDDVRKCIALGATMSMLGINQIHQDRWQSDLPSKLREAPSQSEIKILGIVASGISGPMMEDIITQRLKDGCKFKILCLNPESSFVDLRAEEENRGADEMREDIRTRISGWRNFVDHRLPENMRSQVELRCYESTPRYFLFITATAVVVGFYLGRVRGGTGAHLELEVKGGGIGTAFIEHFDSLWKGAKGSPAS